MPARLVGRRPMILVKSRWVRVIALTVASLYVGRPAQAALGQSEAATQAELLGMLKSDKRPTRGEAVERLRSLPVNQWSSQLREQVLELYSLELDGLNAKLQGRVRPGSYSEAGGEAFAEYFGYLGSLVLQVDGDRGLKLLVDTPSEPMADSNKVLAGYGERILPLVLDRLKQLATVRFHTAGYNGPDYHSQAAVADILGNMVPLDRQGRLDPRLTPADYAQIRGALRPLLESPNDYVRLYAGLGLARIGDDRDAGAVREALSRFLSTSIPGQRSLGLEKIAGVVEKAEFVPVEKVKQLARSDPYHYQRKGPHGRAVTTYPVRERATELLRKLSATGAQAP